MKLFVDGVVESQTAAMLAPYATSKIAGTPAFTPEQLTRIVTTPRRAGLAGVRARDRRPRDPDDARRLSARRAGEPGVRPRTTSSHRAYRDARSGGPAAVRVDWRRGVDAAGPRRPGARSDHRLEDDARRRACLARLDVREPAGCRRARRVRQRLARGVAGSALRAARRHDENVAERRAGGRLDPEREDLPRRRAARLHGWRRLGVVRRAAEGHAEARHACRRDHPVGRALRP